jgi:hypothetical protein
MTFLDKLSPLLLSALAVAPSLSADSNQKWKFFRILFVLTLLPPEEEKFLLSLLERRKLMVNNKKG